ncbi:hypothetical protein CP533_6083 [Ophiocordyceps camponoti-saundersi (nom. inval.)]|nr:hypothetical protein CP533_6083 [Ophiocordyceps camponoti-saundersi (nom. inval.)]
MLAFVLSSVLVASGAIKPTTAFPCNTCINDALVSYNVTHDVTVNDVHVPLFSSRKAVTLGEPKAADVPENRLENSLGRGTELSDGAVRGAKACGKPRVQSPTPADSPPAQSSPQDDAGRQDQLNEVVPVSPEQPQKPSKQQSLNERPRRKCKKPFSKSQSPVGSPEKPFPPAEPQPQINPARKSCRPGHRQSKSPAKSHEQPAVKQPTSNGEGGSKPVEEQTKPSKNDNQPVEEQTKSSTMDNQPVEKNSNGEGGGKPVEQQTESSKIDNQSVEKNSNGEGGGKPVEPQTESSKIDNKPVETEQQQGDPPKKDDETDNSIYEPAPQGKTESKDAAPEHQPAPQQQPSPQGPADQGKEPAKVTEKLPTEPDKPAENSGPSQGRPGGEIKVTAHDKYASSIGVLGCKGVNLARVAFFPGTPGCDDFCVEVKHKDRSVYLLRIDSSGNPTTFDISCQAYDYLVHGTESKNSCKTADRTPMTYETVDPEKCKGLLAGGELPISAPNPNYYTQCANSSTFKKGGLSLALYNINDSRCQYGIDEKCTWSNPSVGVPECKSGLGKGNTSPLQQITDPSYGG